MISRTPCGQWRAVTASLSWGSVHEETHRDWASFVRRVGRHVREPHGARDRSGGSACSGARGRGGDLVDARHQHPRVRRGVVPGLWGDVERRHPVEQAGGPAPRTSDREQPGPVHADVAQPPERAGRGGNPGGGSEGRAVRQLRRQLAGPHRRRGAVGRGRRQGRQIPLPAAWLFRADARGLHPRSHAGLCGRGRTSPRSGQWRDGRGRARLRSAGQSLSACGHGRAEADPVCRRLLQAVPLAARLRLRAGFANWRRS